MNDKIILGIDPGTNIMGYGIIFAKGTKISLIKMGILKLNAKKNQLDKLQDIYETVSQLIMEYTPHEMAIESPFFGKNVQSMLKLGRAQGVSIAAALTHNVPVFEYAPKKVKMAIVGKGAASKEQVAAMLCHIIDNFHQENIPTMDASDAVAIAYCHYLQNSPKVKQKESSSWANFLAKNPDRIVK